MCKEPHELIIFANPVPLFTRILWGTGLGDPGGRFLLRSAFFYCHDWDARDAALRSRVYYYLSDYVTLAIQTNKTLI